MRATLFLPPSVVLIEAALQGLVAANRVLIQAGVVPPSPLDADVRYKREGSGLEEWKTAADVLKSGVGDCEDLNCWECAAIQLDGDSGAIAKLIRTGKKRLHCVVELSSGEIVDVCPDLGMKTSQAGIEVQGLPWLDVAGEEVRRDRRARANVPPSDPKKRLAWLLQKKREAIAAKKRRRRPPRSDSSTESRTPTRRQIEDPSEPTTMEPRTMAATQEPRDDEEPGAPEMPMMDESDVDAGLPDEELDSGGVV